MTPPGHARRLRQAFTAALLGGLLIECILGVIAILIGGFGDPELTTRVLLTPVLCVLVGAVGLGASIILERGRLRVAIHVLMALLVAAALHWGAAMWVPALRTRAALDIVRPIGATLTTAVFILGLSAHLLTLETRLAAVRVAAVCLVAALGAYGLAAAILAWTFPLWSHIDDAAIAIAIGLCMYLSAPVLLTATALMPWLARTLERRRVATSESIARRPELTFACPRCRTEQSLATGLQRCRACRLAMIIEIEEPRCPCGYLLFRLEGDRCPECGLPVSAARP